MQDRVKSAVADWVESGCESAECGVDDGEHEGAWPGPVSSGGLELKASVQSASAATGTHCQASIPNSRGYRVILRASLVIVIFHALDPFGPSGTALAHPCPTRGLSPFQGSAGVTMRRAGLLDRSYEQPIAQ